MSQIGIFPWSQPMPHTHRSFNQGGIISNDDLYQGCGVHACRNAIQDIPNMIITKILFDTEFYDIGGDFDADGVDSNFITPSTGYYFFNATMTLNMTNVDKQIFMYLYKDGISEIESFVENCITGNFSSTVSALLYLILGEVLDVRIWHNSGLAQAIIGGLTTNYLHIFKIGE